MSATKQELRQKRKSRVRGKISGTSDRPRLSVFRSSKHLYAQVIDDACGKTLVSVGSYGSDKRAGVPECAELGKKLAEKCKTLSISNVVFDKNGFKYHGRLKSFADGAREGGLSF